MSKDKKGFEIPIEGGSDEKDMPVAEGEVSEESQVEASGKSAEEESAPAESVEPADSEAPEETEAVEGESEEARAETSEDEIIAEAEAVVEEASEAAGLAELEKARQEASEWQDRYYRLHAEWDTYRRRTTEQRAEEKARATEKLVEDLLPVLDDFERSIAYAEENGEGGLLEGVKAVQTKLLNALAKSGLETIDPAGEAYDALEAQAVATVPDEEAYDETVKDVYQKGYRMGKKVLRAAMVTVTTGGPKRPKEDAE